MSVQKDIILRLFPGTVELPDFLREYPELQTVFLCILIHMPVMRTELSFYSDKVACIIPVHIHKPFRDHQRDPVLQSRMTVDEQVRGIKAFSEDPVTEYRFSGNGAFHFYLIAFPIDVFHFCSPPLLYACVRWLSYSNMHEHRILEPKSGIFLK